MEQWRRNYGKSIRRLRLKSLHRQYVNGDIHFWQYKESIFVMVNTIRAEDKLPRLHDKQLEEGWAYLHFCSETYSRVFDAMINFIYGWW